MQTILKLLGEIGLQTNYWRGYIIPITPVGEKMKPKQTNVEETDLWETIIRVEAQNKASGTPSLYAVSLWYWYKPKARQQFLLHMRLHFGVTELVQCTLFVNRSWHQELGFRSYV